MLAGESNQSISSVSSELPTDSSIVSTATTSSLTDNSEDYNTMSTFYSSEVTYSDDTGD